MSQSPITQVSPEGENHAISTLITQVPESKLYSITKPEDKDSAIHSTPSKTISNSTSDISTTLANTSTSSPTSPKSSSSSNLKTTRRISSRFFSLFLCCTLSSRAIISNKEKIVRNINNTVNDNNSNSSNNDDISNPINISTTAGIGNGTTEKQSPSNSSKNNEIDQIDNIYPVTEVKGEGKEIDRNWLLDPIGTEHIGRKCLVLDLDETLVHSSFKTINQPDFVIPVDIENQIHNVYVIKRPGVDRFLRKMGELYEVVVFTASLPKYADPVLDMLDIHKVVKHRLFRESCSNHKGNYVKDLSHIGRELKDTIIIDNSPASYIFHPKNAVPISSWFNDPHDTELLDLIPFLEDLTTVDDVRIVLDSSSVPQL